MKTLLFKSIALVTFLSLIVACDNDNDDKIKVNAEKVRVRENLEQKIEVSGGTGSYSCEVDDNEIATAKIVGQKLTITGHKAGTTSVTIKDGSSSPVSIAVQVLSQKIILEVIDLKSEMEIGKRGIYDLILEEVEKLFPFPIGTKYELTILNEITAIKGPDTIGGELIIQYDNKSINGTFRLYGEEITMLYSGQTYRYSVDAGKENWNIIEDFTQQYKKEYPEADIRYVYNYQVLKVVN